MITFKHHGHFNNTEKFLNRAQRANLGKLLAPYGQEGVDALAAATPKLSGETASSWSYEISVTRGGIGITWINSKMAGKAPLVILLQFGHGTGTGGYVQGRDFINPAIRPVFDRILNDVWREVTQL